MEHLNHAAVHNKTQGIQIQSADCLGHSIGLEGNSSNRSHLFRRPHTIVLGPHPAAHQRPVSLHVKTGPATALARELALLGLSVCVCVLCVHMCVSVCVCVGGGA